MSKAKSIDMDSFSKYAYNPNTKVGFTFTCSKSMDTMLNGGIPNGCIVEMYGHEGSGKSSFFLNTASHLNAAGLNICIIDTEGGICSKEYLDNIGIDYKKTHIYNVSSLTSVFDLVEAAIANKQYSLIIVDSIASTVTDDEINNIDSIGSHARSISSRLKKIVNMMNERKLKTSLVLINQMRSKINDMWKGEMNYTTAGGKSIRYYATLRLEIDRYEYIKHKEEKIGFYSRIRVIKSRFCSPHKQIILPFLYGKGYSENLAIIDKMIENNFISSLGGWTTLKIGEDITKFRNKFEMLQKMESEKDFRNYIVGHFKKIK